MFPSPSFERSAGMSEAIRPGACGLLVGFPQDDHIRRAVRAHHSECFTVRRPTESGDQIRSEVCNLMTR